MDMYPGDPVKYRLSISWKVGSIALAGQKLSRFKSVVMSYGGRPVLNYFLVSKVILHTGK